MVTEAEALDKSHTDLARRLADAGRKAESDAKVIAALRLVLIDVLDCLNKLGPDGWSDGPHLHSEITRALLNSEHLTGK